MLINTLHIPLFSFKKADKRIQTFSGDKVGLVFVTCLLDIFKTP